MLEATLAPALLFYVVALVVGGGAAMTAVLVWTYGAVLRRVVNGKAVPTVLILATTGLTVRTVVGLLSGSMFAYFLQPVATTLTLAAVFFASALIGRPLVARMAHDFVPLHVEVSGRPEVVRLFANLTFLWAAAHLLNAAVTFGLLVTFPTLTFVALKTFTSLAITVVAIVLTVSWAIRTAQSENLEFATADA